MKFIGLLFIALITGAIFFIKHWAFYQTEKSDPELAANSTWDTPAILGITMLGSAVFIPWKSGFSTNGIIGSVFCLGYASVLLWFAARRFQQMKRARMELKKQNRWTDQPRRRLTITEYFLAIFLISFSGIISFLLGSRVFRFETNSIYVILVMLFSGYYVLKGLYGREQRKT